MRHLSMSLLVLSLAFLAACGGDVANEGANNPETPNPSDAGTPAVANPTTTVVLDVEGMT